MKTYRVEWAIDIDADDPVDAAKRAREIQMDPASSATVFDVIEHDGDGEAVQVDLMEECA